MARKEEIEILISEDGFIKFHIKGIKGPKCLDLAKVVGKPLGELKDVNLTSEYYEKEIIKEKAKQKIK
ncbi:MAG: DUF2997 domain-containing protein [Candidatus Omnitrophica bacterium]|nr:DUF2997 domain-containing protein [Candidatus Omnitrophota bacterium]